MTVAAQLWQGLGKQRNYYTEPVEVYDWPIWMMRTRQCGPVSFMFDDAFWEVFHSLPLKVCHVQWVSKGQQCDEDALVFEIRFAPTDWIGHERT